MGVFITLEDPSRDSNKEAVSAGSYHSPGWDPDYPRLRISTINNLMHGVELKMPPQHGTYKEALRVRPEAAQNPQLDFG